MRDKAGPWLAIDRAEVVWRPLALLRGQLRIDLATAQGVRLDRLPESEPAADGSPGLSLPSLPVAVRLDRFALDDVEIGAAVAGETVALRASGRLAAETDGRARTNISLTRTNGVGGEANLAVVWNPADTTLDLDARVDEPRGGVLGRALGLADQPPMTAAVAGHGPIEAWDGHADIAFGEAVGVKARIRSGRFERAGRFGGPGGARARWCGSRGGPMSRRCSTNHCGHSWRAGSTSPSRSAACRAAALASRTLMYQRPRFG